MSSHKNFEIACDFRNGNPQHRLPTPLHRSLRCRRPELPSLLQLRLQDQPRRWLTKLNLMRRCPREGQKHRRRSNVRNYRKNWSETCHQGPIQNFKTSLVRPSLSVFNICTQAGVGENSSGLKQAFFLTPAAGKTKTQGKNSSQKLKEKTQPPGRFSLQLGKFKKKT